MNQVNKTKNSCKLIEKVSISAFYCTIYCRTIIQFEKSICTKLYYFGFRAKKLLTIYGLTPLWILSCLSNWDGFWNFLPQVLHSFLSNFALLGGSFFFFLHFNFKSCFSLLWCSIWALYCFEVFNFTWQILQENFKSALESSS